MAAGQADENVRPTRSPRVFATVSSVVSGVNPSTRSWATRIPSGLRNHRGFRREVGFGADGRTDVLDASVSPDVARGARLLSDLQCCALRTCH